MNLLQKTCYLVVAFFLTTGCDEHSVNSDTKTHNNITNENKACEAIWESDFETQTIEAWSYALNPQGIEISSDNAYSGEYAAKISLQGTPDFLWNNKPELNRSELQYKPKNIRENTSTRFSFAFMLPELMSEARHEFAYWESDTTYQQIMRFNLAANTISFSHGDDAIVWQVDKLKANKWHIIKYDVLWSSSSDIGQVNVWFDDQHVIKNYKMATLIKNENAFIQLGILRSQTPTTEVVWLDNAIHHC